MKFTADTYKISWSNFVLTICLLMGNNVVQVVDGYCYEINVKNAAYETSMNGNYYVVSNYLCNGLPIWLQTTNSNGDYASYNYIYYTYVIFNTTSSPSYGGWVIGPYMCPNGIITGIAVYAYNQQPYGNGPTNLPNSWYEYDYNSGSSGMGNYVHNYNLDVECDNSLNGWEIFGIVIGSICGFFLLLAILACCCSKCKEKKRRTNPSGPTAVVYSSGGPRGPVTVVTTTSGLSQPAGPSPFTQPVYVISPPAYDNNAPPAYETLSATAAGPDGVVNGGFENKM